MDIHEQAMSIYEQTRPNPQHVKVFGESALTPIQRASLEEIEAHLVMVAEVAAEVGTNLNPSKVEFGMSREEVTQKAEAKLRRWKRGAGARALSAKYGKDAAERIIAKHTGRHYSLQS